MIKFLSQKFILVLMVLFLSTGCTSSTDVEVESDVSLPTSILSAYPAPQSEGETSTSTGEADISYPAPNLCETERFSFVEPIRPGDRRIAGTGPAGTDIRILDVTLAGEVLASGTIDADGQFNFSVDSPLEAEHLIGIGVASVPSEDERRAFGQMLMSCIGDAPRDIPHPDVGTLWDTAFVVAGSD